MASIVFDFLARTTSLDKAWKEENQKVGDFVKRMEEGGVRIDKSFDKVGQSVKNAITKQKDLIKELISDIKRLQDAADASSPGAGKKNLIRELGEAKNYLAQEQERLIQLQQGQIAVNELEEKSHQGVIGTLGKWAMGLLTVGVAMKGFKAIMESTEATYVAFHSNINGMKSALDVFMKTLVSFDKVKWSSLFHGGMYNAFAFGKELTMEMDVIQNVRRQYAIEEENLNKEIEENRRIFYEDDSTSISKKIAAGDDMLEDMKAKADMEVDIAVRTYKAIAEISGAKNKLSEADLQFMVRNYNEMQKVGSQYDDLMTVYEKVKKAYDRYGEDGPHVNFDETWDKEKLAQGIYKLRPTEGMEVMSIAPTAANVKQLEDLIKSLGPLAQEYSDQLKKFDGLNEKEKTAFGDSIVAVMKAENQYLVESKRVFKMKENMTDQEIAKEKEKIKAYNDVINAILILKKEGVDKELQELKGKYEDDLELYKDDEEMKVALKEKYELEKFEIEQKYLKKLLDEAKKAADQIAKDTGISPYSITQRYLSGKSSSGVTTPTGGKLPNGLMASHGDIPTQKNLNKELKSELELRQDIAYVARELTGVLLENLSLEEDLTEALGSMVDMAGDALSGDYLSALAGYLDYLLMVLKSAETTTAEIEERFEGATKYIKEASEMIDKSQRVGGGEGAYKEEQKRIEEMRLQLKRDLEFAEYQLRHATILNRDQREENVANLEAEIDELNTMWEENAQNMNDFLTGGITQNTIADAVANGFIEGGKTGVDSVADYMTNVLKNAAQEVFKASILDDPAMQQYIDATKQALSDGILSPEEKAQFDKLAKEMAETWGPAWESLMGTFETMGQAGGLTGAIKGVTEDTASELAGILRGVRDDVRSSREVDRAGVLHLARIEANTRETADNTFITNKKLDEIITNTRPVMAGDL